MPTEPMRSANSRQGMFRMQKMNCGSSTVRLGSIAVVVQHIGNVFVALDKMCQISFVDDLAYAAAHSGVDSHRLS